MVKNTVSEFGLIRTLMVWPMPAVFQQKKKNRTNMNFRLTILHLLAG